MTFAEMVEEVELLYEFVNSNAAPGFTDAEWATILTTSQRRIVYSILRKGITSDAFNSIALSKLIIPLSYTDFTTDTYYLNSDGTEAQTLDVAADNFDTTIMWILDEYAVTATISRIPLDRISFEEYQINLDNPYRKPNTIEGFWIIGASDSTATYTTRPIFITDGTTITEYHSMNVVHPDTHPIASGSDCVLNESVHTLIVSDAVKLARMSVTDSEGFQLAVAADALI